MATTKTIDPEKLALLKGLMHNEQTSLRDQFVIAVLSSGIYYGISHDLIAANCYDLADCMMKERSKPTAD